MHTQEIADMLMTFDGFLCPERAREMLDICRREGETDRVRIAGAMLAADLLPDWQRRPLPVWRMVSNGCTWGLRRLSPEQRRTLSERMKASLNGGSR